jgi:thiol-disulfide isomerase/thioredoxin
MSDLGSSNELSPQKTYRMMAAVAVAILLLLSVAIYSLSRLSTAPWSSELEAPAIQSTSRQELPHFEYKEDGKLISPQNLEGHWTLLTFWSFSCPPCLVELPGINQLAQSWSGPELEILTVNSDNGEDLDQAKRFLQEQEITLPTLFDKSGALKTAFGVSEWPRHFLIGPDKGVMWAATGAFKWNDSKVRDQLLKLMERQTEDLEKTQDPQESTSPE